MHVIISVSLRACARFPGVTDIQTDYRLGNDVITSITVSLRACARLPGVTYKYGLSPKLAVSSVVRVIILVSLRACARIPGVTGIQTDLENDVITSISMRACLRAEN